jgi:antitoxin PrlF
MGTASAVRKSTPKRTTPIEGHTSFKHGASRPDDSVTERTVEAYVPFSARISSKSRISSKGQITLPALVRERLGVKPGDAVEFFFDGERTVVKPFRDQENPFEKWVGIAKGAFGSEEELIAWEREMRGYDEQDV